MRWTGQACVCLVAVVPVLAACSGGHSGATGSGSTSTSQTSTTTGTTKKQSKKKAQPPLKSLKVGGRARLTHGGTTIHLKGSFTCGRPGSLHLIVTAFQSQAATLARGGFPPQSKAPKGSSARKKVNALGKCNSKRRPWSAAAAAKGKQPLPFKTGVARVCVLALVRGPSRFRALEQRCASVRLS